MSHNLNNNALRRRIRLLVGVSAAVLSVTAPLAAQSVPFPTYTVGENQNGPKGPNYPSTLPAPWVVSNGQIITPAGTQVYLGITTRAKAVALNPNTSTHTAAVLQMGAPQAVTIFNTQTGAVLQTYKPLRQPTAAVHRHHLHAGWHAPAVQPGRRLRGTGRLRCHRQRQSDHGLALGLRPSQRSAGRQRRRLSDHRHLLPEQPSGTTGSVEIPCGQTVSIVSDGTSTSYPLGIAISPDGKTAYAVLDNNDTLTKIDLTAADADAGCGDPRRQRPAQRRDLAGWQDRLCLQRSRPDCYRERLPGILQRHPGRRRLSDRLHVHRHRFRGRPGLVHGHRQHLDRSAPDGHGASGATTCWSPIPIATASR